MKIAILVQVALLSFVSISSYAASDKDYIRTQTWYSTGDIEISRMLSAELGMCARAAVATAGLLIVERNDGVDFPDTLKIQTLEVLNRSSFARVQINGLVVRMDIDRDNNGGCVGINAKFE